MKGIIYYGVEHHKNWLKSITTLKQFSINLFPENKYNNSIYAREDLTSEEKDGIALRSDLESLSLDKIC